MELAVVGWPEVEGVEAGARSDVDTDLEEMAGEMVGPAGSPEICLVGVTARSGMDTLRCSIASVALGLTTCWIGRGSRSTWGLACVGEALIMRLGGVRSRGAVVSTAIVSIGKAC